VANKSSYKGYEILIGDINKLQRANATLVGAINSVLVEMSSRIFEQGEDSRNAKIGTYSTKPISISKSKQSRNTGKTQFKGGYREYKSLVGKGNRGEFVNLRNTDQMKMDLGTSVNASANEYAIGFTNTFNADKRDWLEDKYGKSIFDSTDKEDEIFFKAVYNKMDSLE
jgi:hypothetical protein